ncbi:MAG TPA: protease pro-enzyme activation domain-containing protein, partial [Opitutaceae bacterium]
MRTLLLLLVLPLVAFGGTRFHGNLSRQAIQIKRAELSAEENAKTLNFQFALPLRNFAELQKRVAAGEVISQTELEEKYYPTSEDYGRVRDWLTAHGARRVQEDATHMTVFAEAPVQVVAAVLQVPFAVVNGSDNNEYVAAVDDPVLPEELQSLVVAVNGLQPQVKSHPLGITTATPTWNGEDCLVPRGLLQLYNGDQTGLTGAGQTIVVLGTQLDTTDLTKFWSDTSMPQALSNFTVVNPGGASWTTTDPTKNGSNDNNVLETTLDCEWASGVAPGAKIELYQTTDWAAVSRQIAAEVKAGNTSIHQISSSFGTAETDLSQNALKSYAQYLAAIAANGITIFAASGDNGSDEKNSQGTSVQTVDWPASDASVTGVGGTSTDLSGYNNLASLVEHAWSSSGGGVSAQARP